MQVGQNRYNTKHGTVSFRLNRDVSVVQCFSTTLQQREKHWQRIKGATENFAENCTYFLLFLCKLQPATRYVYKICHKLFLNLDFTVVGNLRFVLGYGVHPTDCITSTDLLQMSLSICPNIKIMKCSSVPWITLHRFTVGIMVLIQQKRSSPITTTVFKQRDWGLLFQPSHKKIEINEAVYSAEVCAWSSGWVPHCQPWPFRSPCVLQTEISRLSCSTKAHGLAQWLRVSQGGNLMQDIKSQLVIYNAFMLPSH